VSNRPKGHLGRHHPVAAVAARLCKAHLGAVRASGLGGVACGGCWERAIRDDERAVVLFGLPREIEPDPSYVDEIAVELALRGESVALTPTERAEVDRRAELIEHRTTKFVDKGWMPWKEARRIRGSRRDWKGRPKPQVATVAAPHNGRVA
jgi:hypothetical protein